MSNSNCIESINIEGQQGKRWVKMRISYPEDGEDKAGSVKIVNDKDSNDVICERPFKP